MRTPASRRDNGEAVIGTQLWLAISANDAAGLQSLEDANRTTSIWFQSPENNRNNDARLVVAGKLVNVA
jgi:hypothetical protein